MYSPIFSDVLDLVSRERRQKREAKAEQGGALPLDMTTLRLFGLFVTLASWFVFALCFGGAFSTHDPAAATTVVFCLRKLTFAKKTRLIGR